VETTIVCEITKRAVILARGEKGDRRWLQTKEPLGIREAGKIQPMARYESTLWITTDKLNRAVERVHDLVHLFTNYTRLYMPSSIVT
jgi:hypothetical protein